MPRQPRSFWAALLLAALASLAIAPPTLAARSKHGAHRPAARGQAKAKHAVPGGAAPVLHPAEAGTGSAAQDLGQLGQVDPLAGLGIRNPVCDQPGQIHDRQARLACEADGTPESTYPASNYGLDVFVETGVTHPIGDMTWGFATALDGAWRGLLFVLRLVFSLLGLAFGLNPFAQGQTMSKVSGAVGRLYQGITDPWLSTLVVLGGIAFTYRALLRRELTAGVAGTIAGVAMLICGLWVVHQPRESVGRLAALSDEVALGVIAAPQSGSLARPLGGYAEAMSRAWARLAEVPFAGLEFSDARWALGPPPREAVQKADEKFCEDIGALALFAVLAKLGDEDAKEACARIARERYGRPKRVIDLYLRSSPGSPARKALWDLFDGDERYQAKVAAQGGAGVLGRFSMLALFALGLLGAILLLAWLAIRLFTQAAIAFVLLLAAPLALFFPLLGDSGRRAFKRWGLALVGAVLSKAIYAAFLSVCLLGIVILGGSDGATGFLLASAFTWAVFLKRSDLVSWISIGEADTDTRPGPLAVLGSLAAAQRMLHSGGGAVRRAPRMWQRARLRAAEGGEATRQTAQAALKESAGALAESRFREAERTVARFERRYGKVGEDDQAERHPRAGVRKPGTEELAGYQPAKDMIARARGNERRLGERFSSQDIERFAREDAELLRTSRDPADHAHRAGIDRAEFEAMSGTRRQEAEERIERAATRDRQRLAVSSELPGRIAGRPRELLEGLRQRSGESAEARRAHLRRLRRERLTARPQLRRNLSRGA
jgi:hypothetical protein